MSTVNRLTGFSGAFDIDATIQKLMKVERAPRDKLEQKNYTLQYQREDYLKINTQLSALQKKTSQMKLTSNINKMATSVTGNTTAVSVSTTSTAPTGTYTVNVTQVATRASVTSSTFIDADPSTTFDPTKALATQSGSLASSVPSDGTTAVDYKFTINGVEITVDADNESMNSVINKINNSQAGVTAVFDSTTGKINLQSKTAGLVNGATKDGDTITLADTQLQGTTGFLTNVLKLDQTTGTKAQGAIIDVNGVQMTGNTNDFNVNGVKITALAKTNGTAATLETKRDVSAMMQNIKDFIQTYNDTLSLINTEYDEKHNRNYAPLTKEQRNDMTENDAKLWDEEAKKGMLYRDDTLSKARNTMKNATITEFTTTGSSTYKTLGSIGIASTSWKDNGVLTVDDTKLQEALESDPDAVVAMFTNYSTNYANAKKQTPPDQALLATTYKEQGLAYRLYDAVTEAISSIKDKAGYSSTELDESKLGKQMKEISRKMDDLDDLLSKKEDNYYKQFSAMERAMQNYQSQLSAFNLG